MNCIHCKGKMKKGKAPFHIDRKGYHLTLDEVSAWICQQCGETHFDAPEVDYIQKIIQTIEKQTKKLDALN